MKKLALIGHPISHSRSPCIHNHWMQLYGINGRYDLLETQDLASIFSFEECDGYNVTIPFKEEVLNFLDHLSTEAKEIGAVNTIKRTDSGLIGYNTDAMGVKSLVKDSYEKAVIIGTGGAAKAIEWALKDSAKEVIFISRNNKECPLEDWKNIIRGADFLANASPIGMHGYTEIDWDLKDLAHAATVMEMVYAPRQTRLVNAALSRKDIEIIDGITLLIAQAKYSFEIWTGILPDDVDVENVLAA